jgi:hypothetical protein
MNEFNYKLDLRPGDIPLPQAALYDAVKSQALLYVFFDMSFTQISAGSVLWTCADTYA